MILQLENISKHFSAFSVKEIDIKIDQNEIWALIGESGSGKSTILRMIAGFETPDSGRIIARKKVFFNASIQLPPEERKIGMVFQDHALFPHLTVFENVSFGIKNKKDRATKVQHLLELVQLKGYDKRFPNELSGGERQRVAIARALAIDPHLLLLDEPFSNLDALLRDGIRTEVKQIIKKAGIPAIFVTHDIQDTFYAADKVVVLKEGEIQQVGTAKSIYQNPKNQYVAHLFGKINLLSFAKKGMQLETDFGSIEIDTDRNAGFLLFRLEAIHIGEGNLQGEIEAIYFLGAHVEIVLKNQQSKVKFSAHSKDQFEIGQTVSFVLNTTEIQIVE